MGHKGESTALVGTHRPPKVMKSWLFVAKKKQTNSVAPSIQCNGSSLGLPELQAQHQVACTGNGLLLKESGGGSTG